MINAVNNLEKYSPQLLRLSMTAVFLWFGINQLFDPANFIGYLPEFLFSSPFAQQIVIANGIFEIIFGGLLALGLFTRISSFILGLHLIVITFELGYGATAIRDFGLALATLAVTLKGPDAWCLDTKLKSRHTSKH